MDDDLKHPLAWERSTPPPAAEAARHHFEAFMVAVSLLAGGGDGAPPDPRMVELLADAQRLRPRVRAVTRSAPESPLVDAKQLATLFNVSSRTVRRYLAGTEAVMSHPSGRSATLYDSKIAADILAAVLPNPPQVGTGTAPPPAAADDLSYATWVKRNGTKGERSNGKLNVRSQGNPLTALQKHYLADPAAFLAAAEERARIAKSA